jgi:hypothetical protein
MDINTQVIMNLETNIFFKFVSGEDNSWRTRRNFFTLLTQLKQQGWVEDNYYYEIKRKYGF